MRLRTISKDLDEILKLIEKRDKKFIEKIKQLKAKIDYKIEEEEKKEFGRNPEVYQLTRWYIQQWDGKIPEGSPARAAKTFKELLEDFKLSGEEIKELYEYWMNLENVPKHLQKKYSIVLVAKDAKSIVDFKSKLRYIKSLRKELEEVGNKWTSKENERGIDYYLKEEEEPEWWK